MNVQDMLKLSQIYNGSAHMEEYNEAFQVYHGLTQSLNHLRNWLLETKKQKQGASRIDSNLNDWIDIAADLPTQAVKNTLLLKYDINNVTSLKSALTYILSLANHLDTLLVHCSNRGKECNLKQQLKLLYNGEFLLCFTYDPVEGIQSESKDASSLGIHHGVTFVFMTGWNILKCGFVSKDGKNNWAGTPGFQNTFNPSAGIDGMRMIIHDPGNLYFF